MMDTLGSMMAMVTRWHKEVEDDDLLIDAINDAIGSLYKSIILVHMGQFTGAPVTNLQIVAGSERQTIISVPDPIAPPILGSYTDPAFPLPITATYEIGYTLVTESGSETLLSPTAVIAPPAGQLASCSPPAMVNGTFGWNVYARINANPNSFFGKMNDMPLAFNQQWQEDGANPVANQNPQVPAPQNPQVNNTADNVAYIRLMQVQNPDGTWTTWTAGRVDELLFQRAASSIAAATTYQGYAYDILEGNKVEIRPAAGQTLNPRYFYVTKPRRLIYDKALLPFANIDATEFIKDYANSQLDASNKEWSSSSGWAQKADRERLQILQGLNLQSTTSQKAITPYFGW